MKDPKESFYLRIVQASAWCDLVITAGFATPWTYAPLHDALSSLGNRFGLGSLPVLDPVQTLYANLMGSLVVLWALVRITKALPVQGVLDGFARSFFVLWMAYALGNGATRLLWCFIAVEAAFAIAQLLPWYVARQIAGNADTSLNE